MCPRALIYEVIHVRHYTIMRAQMDTYIFDLCPMMTSGVTISIHASVSRKIAFLVGLHVDELEESEIPGQVPRHLNLVLR